MANATATKKLNDAKRKASEEGSTDAPTKEATATRPQRVSARINLTTTKTIEGQFDTTSRKVDELDKKLVEIARKFEDKPDHAFAAAVEGARQDLKTAAEALVSAKSEFEAIGGTLRDFFG